MTTMILAKFLHPKYLPTWILIFFMWLATKLPFKVQLWLGKHLGSLLKHLAKSRAKIAKINLSLCFPKLSQQQIEQLVTKNFTELGISLFEVANSWFSSNNNLQKKYRTINLEVLDQAKNNNIIFLVAHFTPVLLFSRFINLHLKIAGVYRPQNNPLIDYFMNRSYTKHGIKMVSVKNPKKIMRTLHSGTPILYAHDQDLGHKDCVFADFFGIPAATITATARLAKLKNTVVIPITIFRDKLEYVMKFEPIIENYPSGDNLADANRTNKILQQQILQAPHQYGWIHKRFKTRPNNEAGFY